MMENGKVVFMCVECNEKANKKKKAKKKK